MVARKPYVPERGDIVWLQFAPQAGHEQAGRRPALVVSPRSYNEKVGLALFCPMTSQIKGYPFEVVVGPGGKAKGAVLSDQLKSLDWRARNARKLDAVSDEVMREVLARIAALVGL
jgi:mRNA interferase MazF